MVKSLSTVGREDGEEEGAEKGADVKSPHVEMGARAKGALTRFLMESHGGAGGGAGHASGGSPDAASRAAQVRSMAAASTTRRSHNPHHAEDDEVRSDFGPLHAAGIVTLRDGERLLDLSRFDKIAAKAPGTGLTTADKKPRAATRATLEDRARAARAAADPYAIARRDAGAAAASKFAVFGASEDPWKHSVFDADRAVPSFNL